jgi:hypothetical protein
MSGLRTHHVVLALSAVVVGGALLSNYYLW